RSRVKRRKKRELEDNIPKIIQEFGKLKAKYKLSKEELIKVITKEIEIPITIFSKELGALETVVKYMKENLGMNYSEIALMLDRDARTIWTAYKKAIEKQKQKIKEKKAEILLPISIFKDRRLTILESIVIYLKSEGLTYGEIAKVLDRDQRNIWTVHSRAVRKIKGKV
ncbi:MAG: hypothetical protein KJ767_02580, partial [Nanoarchaeota archaeon]|nr:hypothetical protein [Nanoarchaeota archaeon]